MLLPPQSSTTCAHRSTNGQAVLHRWYIFLAQQQISDDRYQSRSSSPARQRFLWLLTFQLPRAFYILDRLSLFTSYHDNMLTTLFAYAGSGATHPKPA